MVIPVGRPSPDVHTVYRVSAYHTRNDFNGRSIFAKGVPHPCPNQQENECKSFSYNNLRSAFEVLKNLQTTSKCPIQWQTMP